MECMLPDRFLRNSSILWCLLSGDGEKWQEFVSMENDLLLFTSYLMGTISKTVYLCNVV